MVGIHKWLESHELIPFIIIILSRKCCACQVKMPTVKMPQTVSAMHLHLKKAVTIWHLFGRLDETWDARTSPWISSICYTYIISLHSGCAHCLTSLPHIHSAWMKSVGGTIEEGRHIQGQVTRGGWIPAAFFQKLSGRHLSSGYRQWHCVSQRGRERWETGWGEKEGRRKSEINKTTNSHSLQHCNSSWTKMLTANLECSTRAACLCGGWHRDQKSAQWKCVCVSPTCVSGCYLCGYVCVCVCVCVCVEQESGNDMSLHQQSSTSHFYNNHS